jgi:serine phosphatase RsbU (regulator of sigma subunit)
MASHPQRILVIANETPQHHAIQRLMSRTDIQCALTRFDGAFDKLAEDPAAVVVLAPHAYFNGDQAALVRVLDELCQKQIGAVLMAPSVEDLAAATEMVQGDGFMAVCANCSPEELTGRIDGLLATRPMLQQLRRENAMLRKLDRGVQQQMTQMDEEMRLAARLQTDFLPRRLPEQNGCSFRVLFRPASYVSGDIYDALRLDEHHLGFYIADAVGHGMPAALLTIFIKRTLRIKEINEPGKTGSAYRIIPPDEAMFHLNAEICQQQLSLSQFVTMVYGVLNIHTYELKLARAGHPAPYLLKADGSMKELEPDGALLGVFPEEHFPVMTVQLEPGDNILMYSDVFETAYPGGDEVVNERYKDEFKKMASANPQAGFDSFVAELDRQEGSLHQRDDLTALMMCLSPNAKRQFMA